MKEPRSTMNATPRKHGAEDADTQSPNKKTKTMNEDQTTFCNDMGAINGLIKEGLGHAGAECDPYSNYSLGSTMAFIQTPAEDRRLLRPHERSSLQEYPSIQDIDFLRTDELKIEIVSDVTLESLMRPCVAAGGPVLKVGDIISFHVVGDFFKEIEIIGAVTKHTIPTAQGPFRIPAPSLLISVPPGQAYDLAAAGNVSMPFPNDQYRDKICAPKAIWQAARTQYPPARKAGLEGKDLWESMYVARNGELLGTLHELRLALQFCMNESDLAAQLTFSDGRNRVSKNKSGGNTAKAGFFMLNSGTLFLKVAAEKVASLNQDLLIDLGQELNDQLAGLADEDFAIVLVDSRGSHADGLPMPERPECLSYALTKGPEAFPTAYTKKIAGHSGWSNGRAHMGFPSLCRNDAGEIQVPAPFKYLYRTPAQAAERVPVEDEVHWTDEEKENVKEFHTSEIKNQIRHYPLPLTRSRRPLNIRSMQYRKLEDGWVVDSRAHPDVVLQGVISDEDFEEAIKKPRTREMPGREGKKASGDGEVAGAVWAGYETLGRTVGSIAQKTGRHATIEARFEGYER